MITFNRIYSRGPNALLLIAGKLKVLAARLVQ